MDRTDRLFQVVGDPTRRSILDLLAERDVLTVSQISAHFPTLVRSGISKHLMELREAGMVVSTRSGRQQYYRINPRAIADLLRPWVERYEKYWTGRLDSLKSVAEEVADQAGGPVKRTD
jgi:DNA-binding transcriptional ArsR family regulator